MEPTEMLAAARDGLTVMAERYARLVEGLEDTSVPIPGSEWTVRDAAAHLCGNGHRYAALATGEGSYSAIQMDAAYMAARARSIIDDNPETDPKKLADQIRDGYEHLIAVTATIPADQPVDWIGGLRPTLASTVSIVLGEPILHGYDVAAAVGVPWPIDPGYAALALASYRVFYPAIFQPSASAGLEATYRIQIAGTDPFTVRIADGAYAEVPAASPADCVISADPAAALLVISGRLSQWPAIALGRITFTGDRPEIGPSFADLFVFP